MTCDKIPGPELEEEITRIPLCQQTFNKTQFKVQFSLTTFPNIQLAMIKYTNTVSKGSKVYEKSKYKAKLEALFGILSL